jgi:GNAT superfamily N-acetyltransferase
MPDSQKIWYWLSTIGHHDQGMGDFSIRFATPEDAETVFCLVQQLAVYEKLAHEVVSSPVDFQKALTGTGSTVEALLAESRGQAVGFALFFENFSTFRGRPGLYLEDLFVLPEMRRLGIGTALFERLFQIARDRDYGRIEWAVLGWNTPAIEFYTKKLQARLLADWRVCRVALR